MELNRPVCGDIAQAETEMTTHDHPQDDSNKAVTTAAPAASTTQWNGLICGDVYFDAIEYEFLDSVIAKYAIRSAIETGAGETSRLFRMRGIDCLSIEYRTGPWLDRAQSAGCACGLVSFDAVSRLYDELLLRRALGGRENTDLLLIDSPAGMINRRKVLDQFLSLVKTRYVMVHDAYRDCRNIYCYSRDHRLRVVEFCASGRGLVLLGI